MTIRVICLLASIVIALVSASLTGENPDARTG